MPEHEPYFPRHGNDGYRVAHYDLALAYRIGPNRLDATALLTATAEPGGPLGAFELDLSSALRVERVGVDGARVRHTHRTGKLRVTLPPGRPLAPGASFRIEVRYAGTPRLVSSPYGGLGWEQLTDGVLVASQPIGAPSWFPCDDRPDRKATYRIAVTTAAAYHVVANGVLAEKTPSGSNATWVYRQEAPMATYLATVQIGRYRPIELPGDVPQQLVVPPRLAARARTAFARQARMMQVFAQRFGPYPFAGYTALVADDELEIPIEAQGLSVFGANHLDEGWDTERLVAHELAHQWFGNSLTLTDWRDIWLHEGFAAYAEWLWSEASGQRTADEHARRWHRRLERLPQDLVLADPGVTELFDDRVYKRGALALHALRLTVGDEAFFRIVREWTAAHRHAGVRTADFAGLFAGHYPGLAAEIDDQGSFFARWLERPRLPQLPVVC
jgi:aminopeptidase N